MGTVISSALLFRDVTLNHVHTRDDFDTQAHDHLVDIKLTFNSKGNPAAKGDYVALPVTDNTIEAIGEQIRELTKGTHRFTFEKFAVHLLDGINKSIPQMRQKLHLKSEFYLSSVLITVEEGKSQDVDGVTHPKASHVEYSATLVA
ncbi:MAG: hypothetical protein KDJ35_03880 [Alphaproteobacteria bacterium]|nr:hypothetical protein [Alphaproteobacteria bacterium]